jgi:pimeloyl-ACP methyl ester carboxylesterase
MRDARIPVGRLSLHGTLRAPDPAPAGHPGVLFLHGWGGSQRQDIGVAKRLVALGCTCLTFNLRGHGRTRRQIATVTRADNLRDALAAYDGLVRAAPAGDRLVAAVGSSYGAYLAALLCAERRLRWLVLRVPALYRDEDFDRPKTQLNLDDHLPVYRRRALTPAHNRALAQAARFEGDVLVVESEHDALIPHQVIRNYLDAFGRARSVTHRVIRGADHALSRPAWRRAYGAIVSDWFAARLPSGATPGREAAGPRRRAASTAG